LPADAGSVDERVAAAVESLRTAERSPDDPDLRGHFVAQATALAEHGWDTFDAVLPLLADDDAVCRAAAAQILGRLGQADRATAQTVCDSLIAVAAEEVDDGVVDALRVAAHDAGLTVGAASNLLLRTPPLRRMGAYHLAMVVSSAPEDESIRKVLRIATDDPDPEVRRWAELGLETAALE
jgi:HEAT repeat protein